MTGRRWCKIGAGFGIAETKEIERGNDIDEGEGGCRCGLPYQNTAAAGRSDSVYQRVRFS